MNGKIQNIALIGLILFITAIVFHIRNYLFVPIFDDLTYKYILGYGPLDPYEYQPVQSVSDAITSQSRQYFCANGRTILHVLVQMFAGPWGRFAFNIVNTVMFVFAVWLMGYVSLEKKTRLNPLLWILIVCFFLYLFPGGSRFWYLIVGCFNYLYPLILSLVFFIIYERVVTEKNINKLLLLSGVVISFLSGWSMECYALPISGATFVLMIVMMKVKSWKWSILYMNIPLWIGTSILVFAPGNFARAKAFYFVTTLISGVKYLLITIPFWLALICLTVIVLRNKGSFTYFFIKNKLYLLCFLFSVSFGLVANTQVQSFYGVAFFSGLIFFKALSSLLPQYKNSKNMSIIGLCLLIGVVIHQIQIIKVASELKSTHIEFIDNYVASDTGVMEVPTYSKPLLCAPFINSWFDDEKKIVEWNMCSLQNEYGMPSKQIKLLTHSDYQIYLHPEKVVSLKTIAGSANGKLGDEVIVVDGSLSNGQVLMINYDDAEGKVKKLMRTVCFQRFVSRQALEINEDAVRTIDNKYILLKKTSNKPIKSIDIN